MAFTDLSAHDYWRQRAAAAHHENEALLQSQRDEIEALRRRVQELLFNQSMLRAAAAEDLRQFCLVHQRNTLRHRRRLLVQLKGYRKQLAQLTVTNDAHLPAEESRVGSEPSRAAASGGSERVAAQAQMQQRSVARLEAELALTDPRVIPVDTMIRELHRYSGGLVEDVRSRRKRLRRRPEGHAEHPETEIDDVADAASHQFPFKGPSFFREQEERSCYSSSRQGSMEPSEENSGVEVQLVDIGPVVEVGHPDAPLPVVVVGEAQESPPLHERRSLEVVTTEEHLQPHNEVAVPQVHDISHAAFEEPEAAEPERYPLEAPDARDGPTEYQCVEGSIGAVTRADDEVTVAVAAPEIGAGEASFAEDSRADGASMPNETSENPLLLEPKAQATEAGIEAPRKPPAVEAPPPGGLQSPPPAGLWLLKRSRDEYEGWSNLTRSLLDRQRLVQAEPVATGAAGAARVAPRSTAASSPLLCAALSAMSVDQSGMAEDFPAPLPRPSQLVLSRSQSS